LDKKPSIQIICVGPVIDLYGRFAAEKLARLMEMYPDRVFSKPEFTALPPYLFSGADFALIPSRDEPFGLVAVEFGRKGALGVGSRLGGLGLMPGWVSYVLIRERGFFLVGADVRLLQWFPVESTSTEHMLSQLSRTIKMALKSTEQERQLLRARSAVQRFPVVEWRQRTEDFHSRSITASRSIAGSKAWRKTDGESGPLRPIADHDDWNPEHQADPSQPDWDRQSYMNSPRMGGGSIPGSPDAMTPGTGTDPFLLAPSRRNPDRASVASDMSEDYFAQRHGGSINNDSPSTPQQDYGKFLDRANRQIARDKKNVPDPFLEPGMAPPNRPFGAHSRVSSVESISSIVDEKQNSPLNKAIASVSLLAFLCHPLLSGILF
jgi:alpha-1,3-glucan synthase